MLLLDASLSEVFFGTGLEANTAVAVAAESDLLDLFLDLPLLAMWSADGDSDDIDEEIGTNGDVGACTDSIVLSFHNDDDVTNADEGREREMNDLPLDN